mmetsp:Transcript_8990/g.17559  ORF Transcript_8990/g.17559 Transcript_8990/m.17559 type:complete len:202 (-) Transcript_8990:402-1007(-)
MGTRLCRRCLTAKSRAHSAASSPLLLSTRALPRFPKNGSSELKGEYEDDDDDDDDEEGAASFCWMAWRRNRSTASPPTLSSTPPLSSAHPSTTQVARVPWCEKSTTTAVVRPSANAASTGAFTSAREEQPNFSKCISALCWRNNVVVDKDGGEEVDDNTEDEEDAVVLSLACDIAIGSTTSTGRPQFASPPLLLWPSFTMV